jgi:glycosyltransferase involved in cell wall biosynthesis
MAQANPNNVFMIGWEYPPHNSGGLGVACAGLTQALANRGDKISFTLPYRHNQAVDHMQILTCQDPSWLKQKKSSMEPPFLSYSSVSSLPMEVMETTDGFKLRTLPTSQLERKVNQYADRVFNRGIKQKDFNVIHAHDWMAFPAGLKLKQKTGKPLVAHVHSTEFDRSALSSGSQYISATEFEGLKVADKVIVVSYYTKRLLIDKYQVDANKIEVVYNGIDPLENRLETMALFATKRPVIAFMGRLTLQKGVEFFITVAKEVLKKIPNALFVIAGSGDMYHELLLRTAQEGVSASVLFSGFIRDEQKEKLLNRADVFLMPSVSEPFGLVALEAAQRGIPVIVSTNAGVSEVLPHGIAVDFWDVDKMAKAVINVLADPKQAQQVSKGQIEDVKEVTWDRAAQKVQMVYRKMFLGE